ncbi:MAG: type II secretion system GspH family protein [Candidatus Omnitrophica bacterium]|nr:type II secretion system GspH family protein [Candidatus Omnitrophota bacterium]
MKNKKQGFYSIKRFNSGLAKGSLSLTGFTLVEILITTMIMAIAITATLQSMNYLLQNNEADNISVICMNTIEGMMDEIRNVTYEDIVANYNGTQFTLAELTARGIQHSGMVMANELEAGFLTRAKIVVCWQNRTRIIGEDVNFNGVLDDGEDANGNGELDSPMMIEAAIAY